MIITAAGGTVHWLRTRSGETLRTAHWPEGTRGTVILLHGRTEFIEKYLEPIALLQNRGFAVWTLDWRGQGASTRPLPDRTRHHVERFEDYVDDLSRLLDVLVLPALDSRKLILIGHSMGGTIGATILARRPDLFTRAILITPMLGFRTRVIPSPVARLIVQLACLIPGQRRRFGPGTHRRPNSNRPFATNRLTSDPTRYASDIALVRDTPELGVGGATWGWLRAAMAAMADLQNPAITHPIAIPVLLAIAGQDRIVDNKAIRRLALRLRRGKVLVIAGARHELLRESDQFQKPLWSAFDQFLDEME